MGLPTDDDCDDCMPSYLRASPSIISLTFSTSPFLLSFLLVYIFSYKRLWPFLSSEAIPLVLNRGTGASSIPSWSPSKSATRNASGQNGYNIRNTSAFCFASTLALAAVLGELVLCEISDSIDPAARGLALKTTVFLLLILLVGVIPSLEIRSLITSAGWSYSGSGRLRFAWVLHCLCFAGWILGFYWFGHVVLARQRAEAHKAGGRAGLIADMTEHVGVIGISFMALLSGFASVSNPYQSFVAAPKPVSETMVARKLAGLQSTRDMLEVKKSRLRALEQRMATAAPEGFLQKATGVFRTNADVVEKKTLEMEISGLDDMILSLSSQHTVLSARHTSQQRAKTPTGQFWRLADTLFSIYCVWRIFGMTLTFIRRQLAAPETTFVGADPINNILGLLVRHYDSQLDRAAWMRQISFLLSGVMILASVNSVIQTFHIVGRFLPSLLRAAQANLGLLVAQLCATYVISVALLLRGIMPADVVGERLRAMGGSDLLWVDGYFEIWFLAGVLITGCGIVIAAKIRGLDDWDEEDDDLELGKRR